MRRQQSCKRWEWEGRLCWFRGVIWKTLLDLCRGVRIPGALSQFSLFPCLFRCSFPCSIFYSTLSCLICHLPFHRPLSVSTNPYSAYICISTGRELRDCGCIGSIWWMDPSYRHLVLSWANFLLSLPFFFFPFSIPHPPPPSTASLLDLQRDWKQAELISRLVLHSAASVSFSAALGSAQSCSLSLFALSFSEGSSTASCWASGAGI